MYRTSTFRSQWRLLNIEWSPLACIFFTDYKRLRLNIVRMFSPSMRSTSTLS